MFLHDQTTVSFAGCLDLLLFMATCSELPVHRELSQHPIAFVYGFYIAIICPVKPKEFLLYFFDDEEKNISRNALSSGWGAGKRGKKENHFPPCLNPNIFILEVFETYSWIGAFAVFFQRIIFKYLPYYHYFLYITVIHAQKQFTHIT